MSGVEQWAVSPCQNCKNRKFGCHADCKKYAEYKAQVDKNKNDYKSANHFVPSYQKGVHMIELTLGKLLKNYRTNNALTSQEVADKLKLSRTRYSQIENGAKDLSPTTIRKIAELLNRKPSEIIKLKGDKNA